MKIKTLERTSTKEIVKAFNESFADYFTPLQLSEQQLISKMAADKTELSLSVGVFDSEKLVGFILHGFDVVDNLKVIYNAGTGVIPDKRGAGLTKRMYQYILPHLQEREVDLLQLEAITQNIQAIRSYEKSGFKIDRKVLCYKGEVKVLSTNPNLDVRRFQDYNWDLLQSFWDIQPTWQNSKNVLDAMKSETIALGAYLDNQLIGYAIFSPDNKRIHQIAVHEKYRNQKIGTCLIGEIIESCGNNLSIINVDENSKSMHSFLETIGFENFLDQFEMKLSIKKGPATKPTPF